MRCKCCDYHVTKYRYRDWYCSDCASVIGETIAVDRERDTVDPRYYAVNGEDNDKEKP